MTEELEGLGKQRQKWPEHFVQAERERERDGPEEQMYNVNFRTRLAFDSKSSAKFGIKSALNQNLRPALQMRVQALYRSD